MILFQNSRLPDSLTKENFWNAMQSKYPVAMDRFCKWIDEYKNRVHWYDLVNANFKCDAPKYHELPLAVQIGIFLQFVSEVNELAGHNDSTMVNLVESIPKFLEKTNKNLLTF